MTWNPWAFSDPYQAVSTADCVSKLSEKALMVIQIVFSESSEFSCIANSGRIKVATVVKASNNILSAKDVQRVLDRELPWFINEMMCDCGRPKPGHFRKAGGAVGKAGISHC